MALAEGAPVSVGVAEGGMGPAAAVAPVSSLSSLFSAESLAPTANFPGFTALSGDASLHVAGDILMSGNPLTDPGWVNYSPLMGDGMLPPGLALEQAMEVAVNAWETSVPLSGYLVIAEAESIAAEAWRATETVIAPETGFAIGEPVSTNSSDESVATEVARLAEEVGLPKLAHLVREDYGVNEVEGLEEETEQELASAQQHAEPEIVQYTQPDENQHLDSDEVVENEEAKDDETVQNEEQEENTDGEEQEDRKDEEQRPPVSPPRPMVSESTDERREQLVIAAVNRESREAKERGKRFSVSTIADTFERNAAESPIRKQLGLVVGEEQGVKSIAISLRSQTFVSSPATILHTARAAIAQHSAVVLATTGTEASQEAVEGALGSSRRNPFS